MIDKKHLLSVGRYKFNPDWTLSNLYVEGVKDGNAVEDEIRDVKVHGETAVDYGIYPLGLRMSPKFSKFFLYSESKNILIDAREKNLPEYKEIKDFKEHELIWVKDCPRHEFVLVHWGNSDDDTDGCLIVGSAVGMIGGQEGVVSSRNYYKRLYPKLYKKIKAGGQTINYFKEK